MKNLNVLFDIGHPAHVHLYKYIINSLKINNHNIYITCKNSKPVIELLQNLDLDYLSIGDKKDLLLRKAFNQIIYTKKLISVIKKYDINIIVGGITAAHSSRLSKTKSIILDDDDDEVQPLFTKLAHPFCDCVLSPDVLKEKRKKKNTIYYSGYHELAYLHPKRFSPDLNILKEAGLKESDTFFIMRFNVFKAHHDAGIKGISLENKLKLIELLKPFGRIFITTEREIEPELLEYQYKLSPEKIHSLLYYATMFIGDSQTMTSEAAVLGTPAIRCNSFVGRISYLEDEEHKYGLTYGFLPDDFSNMFNKIKELLNKSGLKDEWKRRKEIMLNDKIDVTAFFVWFIENYPKSVIIINTEPEFQFKFR